MSDEVYERLAGALDQLAGGYPRTASNVELDLLRAIFTPNEAELASVLTGRPVSAEAIAKRVDSDVGEVRETLDGLLDRGIIWSRSDGGSLDVASHTDGTYRLAPFMVGVMEAHLAATRDPAFARLVDDYLAAGGAAGIMAPQPALHRVIPARAATDIEWVLPYDDVRTILANAKSMRVEECYCRVSQDVLGERRCDFPLETCLAFSFVESDDQEGQITRERALAILDQAEQLGLVHTVSNVASGVGYVCNCCGCCCELLRGVNDWGIEQSVAQANYYAEIDPSLCTACGTCQKRCQVAAIVGAGDAKRVVDREHCIGCGVCVTGCEVEAVHLRRKAEEEVVTPPASFEAWELQRQRARGISTT